MKFGELTTQHLGRRIRVHNGNLVIIGAIHHETYHGAPRTVIHDAARVRKWVYKSEQECVLS